MKPRTIENEPPLDGNSMNRPRVFVPQQTDSKLFGGWGLRL